MLNDIEKDYREWKNMKCKQEIKAGKCPRSELDCLYCQFMTSIQDVPESTHKEIHKIYIDYRDMFFGD